MVLVATRNPLNIGAAARAMSNFGFQDLRVVNPFDVAWREARSAVGAAPVLQCAREFGGVSEAVSDCTLVIGTTTGHNRELLQPLHSLPEAAGLIQGAMSSGRVALLFGSEKRGLSNEDLSHCHWLLRIPTREEHPSLNLGQAVAICLFAVANAATPRAGSYYPTKPESEDKAAARQLDLITSTLLDALRLSGYVKPRAGAVPEEKIRRLVRRLDLSAGDAETWLGMLRQVIWRMRQGE